LTLWAAALDRESGRRDEGMAAAKRRLDGFPDSECAPFALDQLSGMFSEAGALDDAMTILSGAPQ